MQIFADRRALHRIPELDRDLPQTLAFLQKSLGSRAFSPMAGALCAFYDFGAHHAIAFRSDMDALPGGHLCGHDGHMAILLELARRLETMPALAHNVLLLFQPGEEATGGARDLCQTGVLEKYRVRAIFGLHIWPGLPRGRVFTRAGPMMAQSCQIDLSVTGQAGHIAHSGADGVGAAAEFVRQTRWESRAGLCKFGLLRGGTAGNIRADRVQLQGSLRCFSGAEFARRQQKLRKTARRLSEKWGCGFSLTLSEGYPAVRNPPRLVQGLRRAADFSLLTAPSLLSEDFSYYQQRLPGAFFFLGAGDGPALHSPDFDFPEEILLSGADFWERLARNSPV